MADKSKLMDLKTSPSNNHKKVLQVSAKKCKLYSPSERLQPTSVPARIKADKNSKFKHSLKIPALQTAERPSNLEKKKLHLK